MITLDASVLVAAGASDDPASGVAAECIAAILAEGLPLHQPTLTLVEVAAAIARRTGDGSLASDASSSLVSMPGVILYPLDMDATAGAAAIAAQLRLRGADAIYVATAFAHGATLISLDDEQRQRGTSLIPVATPAEWLDSRSPSSA